jgi:hypothetical protein
MVNLLGLAFFPTAVSFDDIVLREFHLMIIAYAVGVHVLGFHLSIYCISNVPL